LLAANHPTTNGVINAVRRRLARDGTGVMAQ